MDRDTARTLLLGLGSPASDERRADAIGAVVDQLLQADDGDDLEVVTRRKQAAEQRAARHAAEADVWEAAARKSTTALDLYRGGLTQGLYGRDYDVPGDDVLLRAAVAQIAEAQQLPELRARMDQLVQTEEAAIDLIAFATSPQPDTERERLESYEAAVERFRRDSGLPAGIADEPTDTEESR